MEWNYEGKNKSRKRNRVVISPSFRPCPVHVLLQ